MATVRTFTFPADKGGGKLTSFTYSRSLGDLAGTWTAEIANVTNPAILKAGKDFDMPGVMKNGLIEHVWTDPDGLMHLSGKDAGVRLMRTTPPAQYLAKGNASAVIRDLSTTHCGVTVNMSGGGLGGFNVRSAVSGTTCAEAILELAMLSGCVAYIDINGILNIKSPPSGEYSEPTVVLDDSGSELDLDGYATQVTVSVTRRKKTLAEEKAEDDFEYEYRGSSPPGYTTSDYSGSFSYSNISGSYSVTMWEPIMVIKESTTTITRDNVEIVVHEEHEYDKKIKIVWRENQQYGCYAWAETGYTITKTVSGGYPSGISGTASFVETTEETMTRSFSNSSLSFVQAPWYGDLNMLSNETITRKTTRSGENTSVPDPNMPTYDPPGDFDVKIIRNFDRRESGRVFVCAETEIKYEARQLGQLSRVLKYDESSASVVPLTVFDNLRYLCLPTHTTPVWVPIKTSRISYEKYKNDGTCVFNAQSEWSDNGAEWIVANGLNTTGNSTIDKYQEDYAKFTQSSSGLQINVGGGGSQNVWSFLELQGMVKVNPSEDSTSYGVAPETWYINGNYVPSKICPHYEEEEKKCGIYGISAIGDFTGESCPYDGKGWQSCIRAKAALEQARADEDKPLLEPPVVYVASVGDVSNRPCAGYQREFYVDDFIDQDSAESIAESAAKNILKVKGTKGIRKTIVVPYAPSIEPNGQVVSVSHDWANMRTTLSYRTSGDIPEFAIPASASGISDGVSGRNSSRRTRPMSGTVLDIKSNGTIDVSINAITYPCTSKLVNIAKGDSVLVSFSSGNSVHGHIVQKM